MFGTFSTRTINKSMKRGIRVTHLGRTVTAVRRVRGSLMVRVVPGAAGRLWWTVGCDPVVIHAEA